MWLKRALLVLSTVAGVLAIPGTSFADAYAPTVDSVGPLSNVTLTGGSTLSVPFTASDTGGSGVTQVDVIFDNSRASRMNQWVVATWYDPTPGQSSVSATATTDLSQWVASGTWTLQRVTIRDAQNNQRDYYPDGISTIPDDGTNPPNNIDWNQSFSVDNLDEDITEPTLTGMHVLESDVIAGEPVIVLYDAHDDNSGVSFVDVTYDTPHGTRQEVYNNDPLTAPVGPAAWLVPLTAYGGTYTVSYIDVYDRAGNIRQYGLAGDPEQGSSLDIHSADFNVNAVAEDRTMPTLDSISLRSGKSLHPGDQVALDYSSHDDATGVVHAEAWWLDTENHQTTAYTHCDLGAESGTLTMTLPGYAAMGTWQLLHLEVVDGQGNIADYQRTGTIWKQPSDGIGPDTHSFDFSAEDFTVSAGTPSAPVASDTSNCSSIPDLSFGAASPTALAGSQVRLRGSVQHAGTAVADPVVATYGKDASGVHLVGVKRGADDGGFAQIVTPTKPTSYWARFFGKARGNIADAATSSQQSVRVVHPATIAVVRTSDGQLLREAAGVQARRLRGSTQSTPAVVGYGADTYYFEITNGAIQVRNDTRGWHRFGRPTGGCTGLASTIVRATVRVACVGTDHRVRLTSVRLGTSLPASSRWHTIGSGATAGPSLWATSDGVVHALVRASGGALRTWTSASGWHTLPMTCASRPTATAAGSTAYVACGRSDGTVRVWKRVAGGWTTRLVTAHATGAPALSTRLGVVQLWVTTRAHRLATLALNGGSASWTRWADPVATGVAAGAGAV